LGTDSELTRLWESGLIKQELKILSVVVVVCVLLCVCARNVQSVERLLRRTAAAITWCVSAASSTSAGSVSAHGNHTARRGTSGSFGCRRRSVACLYMFAQKKLKADKPGYFVTIIGLNV